MKLKEIFDTMDYGPARESDQPAQSWLELHQRRFGLFINGQFEDPRADFVAHAPSTGALLAHLTQANDSDVARAVTAARNAQPGWEKRGGPARARVLYALARLVQKYARQLAVLETLDSGKPIREARDIDIPLVARHFYYHAGMAQLMEETQSDREALGVCGQIIPWNFPLLMLAWKIAPALAMGNTVVLKPAEWTSLSALRFCELCAQAGVPPGVVNVITGDGTTGAALVASDIDKIAFTGSTEVGRQIRRESAGSGKALTLELGGKSPFIVFDDADIDSAIEGLVDAIWFNGGQVCCAGSRLLLHEPIAETFETQLKTRMAKLRIGDPLDKSIDLGAMVHPSHRDNVEKMVGKSSTPPYQPDIEMPTGCYYPPTLISDLQPADPLMQEEIFGPVLVSTRFRTPAEAVSLANNTRFGLAASVWSENINLALDIAPKLAAGVIWINSANSFDAAAGFGGLRESGFGREGGWEGLNAYTRPCSGITKKATPVLPYPAPEEIKAPSLDRTAKNYIGGKHTRPDNGQSRAVWSHDGQLLGHVGIGSRKDIRNAVEAARKAAKWAQLSGHARAQVLYFIAENLSARATEFQERLRLLSGMTSDQTKAEVAVSIERLFTWAAWADKNDSAAKDVPTRAVALAMNTPTGVIGQIAPDAPGLLGLVATIAPAIALGNRVICVPSMAFALIAADFAQILQTSDVPAGVVNIVTGSPRDLAPQMSGHADIDAVWSFAHDDLSQIIEQEAAMSLKRTWVNYGRSRDWSQNSSSNFLEASCEIKTIWIPFGEG